MPVNHAGVARLSATELNPCAKDAACKASPVTTPIATNRKPKGALFLYFLDFDVFQASGSHNASDADLEIPTTEPIKRLQRECKYMRSFCGSSCPLKTRLRRQQSKMFLARQVSATASFLSLIVALPGLDKASDTMCRQVVSGLRERNQRVSLKSTLPHKENGRDPMSTRREQMQAHRRCKIVSGMTLLVLRGLQGSLERLLQFDWWRRLLKRCLMILCLGFVVPF